MAAGTEPEQRRTNTADKDGPEDTGKKPAVLGRIRGKRQTLSVTYAPPGGPWP